MRYLSVTIATIGLLALAVPHLSAQRLDAGLVSALDRVGGSLLGVDAFDAVLAEPPDPVEPERLRIYLSETQISPVEIVVVNSPDPGLDPPDPVRAFFRITVGGAEGLKLEFDSRTGEIIPCVVPPADLSDIAAAPADSVNSAGRLRPGLATALGELGANLLGVGAFDAVLATASDPIAPPRLRLFVSSRTRIEFVLTAASDPVTPFARVVGGGPEVELQFDVNALGTRVPPAIEEADLSAMVPPSR